MASGAATAQEAASGLRRLPLPVAVSGTNWRDFVASHVLIKRHLDGVRVYPSGSAFASPAASSGARWQRLRAVSYGDASLAGVGTVTACDDEALLFGHPLLWNGATTATAHQATAVFVQPDPIFGSFKVANVGGMAGTVDQDRLAGLHVDLGATPVTTRVRSALSPPPKPAPRGRDGRGGAAEGHPGCCVVPRVQQPRPGARPIGRGGHAPIGCARDVLDGSTWSFRRREKLADGFDATINPAFKIYGDLWTLFNNRFEAITIDNVSVSVPSTRSTPKPGSSASRSADRAVVGRRSTPGRS